MGLRMQSSLLGELAATIKVQAVPGAPPGPGDGHRTGWAQMQGDEAGQQ